MEPEFWHQRWKQKQIGFHLDQPNTLLLEYWPRSVPQPGIFQPGIPQSGHTVFVPLSGKTLDMLWLREQGWAVIGVELSPIAAAEFFREQGLTPHITSEPPFSVYRSAGLQILCGDIFDLSAERLTGVSIVYDRAALVAFPAAAQERYVQHLQNILPADTRQLLIALEYDPAQMQGPPFSISEQRLAELYQDRYRISRLCDRDALAVDVRLRDRGLTWLRERVYLLEPLAGLCPELD